MSAASFAQEDYTAYKSDASVALGSYVKQTTLDGIKQDATNTGGVLASGSVVTTVSRRTTRGRTIPKSTTGVGVDNKSREVSAAYVFPDADEAVVAVRSRGPGSAISHWYHWSRKTRKRLHFAAFSIKLRRWFHETEFPVPVKEGSLLVNEPAIIQERG